MKEQYIKQVKKELYLSRKKKTEILRDLNEIFASAVEHGETEQQVIERLGTPKDFADSTAEQFGIDNTALQKRKEIISSVVALFIAVASFLIYAAIKNVILPEGAIGQADAMTNIQVASDIAIDAPSVILLIGAFATLVAIIKIADIAIKNRRER